MRVPSSLILSLMLNRLRRSTTEAGERKSCQQAKEERRETGVLGSCCGESRPPPRQGRLGHRVRQGCINADESMHSYLGCDCPSSAVPSEEPWPLSLEESGGGQGLWAQERWTAACAVKVGFGGHRQGVTFLKSASFLLFFKKPWLQAIC